jgi:hypothetical protein
LTATFSRAGACYSATVLLGPLSARSAGRFWHARVLVINDLGRHGRRSVASVIQGVLDELGEFHRELYGTSLPSHIVCRRSDRTFVGVAHTAGHFHGFYPLGAADAEEAARIAIDTHKGDEARRDSQKNRPSWTAENQSAA